MRTPAKPPKRNPAGAGRARPTPMIQPLTPEELEYLRVAAEELGIPRTELVRSAALDAAGEVHKRIARRK